MRRTFQAPIIFALALPLLAQTESQNKKPDFPQLIRNARWVLVVTHDGIGTWGSFQSQMKDAMSPPEMDLPAENPEELKVVEDMEAAIRKWGRYRLARNVQSSELVFVVRRDRSADTLSIYDAGSVRRAHHDPSRVSYYALWAGRLKDGLKGPEVKLLQELRKEVEEAEKPATRGPTAQSSH